VFQNRSSLKSYCNKSAESTQIKKQKDSCKISELAGFQTILILNYSIAFHAVVVTGLFFDFLFKVNLSIL